MTDLLPDALAAAIIRLFADHACADMLAKGDHELTAPWPQSSGPTIVRLA